MMEVAQIVRTKRWQEFLVDIYISTLIVYLSVLIALVANIYDDATSINESKDKLISLLPRLLLQQHFCLEQLNAYIIIVVQMY